MKDNLKKKVLLKEKNKIEKNVNVYYRILIDYVIKKSQKSICNKYIN